MAAEASVLDPSARPSTLEEAHAVIDALRQEFACGMAQLESMKGEVALARVATGQSASSSSAPLPVGCRAVPPANLAGYRRDSESIESWLFSVEQYFDLTGLPDGL